MSSISKMEGSLLQHLLTGWKGSLKDLIIDHTKKIDSWHHPGIEAANEVSIAVDNARVAWTYSGDITKLVYKLDAVVRERLVELEKLVDDAHRGNLYEVKYRAQRFINMLPLDSWQPKLVGTEEPYGFMKSGCLTVSFIGTFIWAAANQGPDLLVIGGQRKRMEPTAHKVTYLVTDLGEVSEAAQKNCQYHLAVLNVPYKWGMSVQTACYDVWVGVYPLPGRITVITPEPTVIRTVKRPYRSMTWSLDRKDFPTNDSISRIFTASPTAGWQFASNTALQKSAEGETNLEVKDGRVTAQVVLDEGKDRAESHVEFEEKKDEIQNVDKSVDVPLPWGEAYPLPPNFKTVVFKSFDGRHDAEFTALDKTNPYLQVVECKGCTYLIAEPK